MIGMKITGIKEMERQLSDFNATIRKRIVLKVLSKCANPLEARMKSLAPVSVRGGQSKSYASSRHPPGYLRASIGKVIGKGEQYPTLWVRPRIRIQRYDAWYAHFPMAGTERMTKAPNPFVDRAWSEVGASVRAAIENDMSREIQVEINKMK